MSYHHYVYLNLLNEIPFFVSCASHHSPGNLFSNGTLSPLPALASPASFDIGQPEERTLDLCDS